jgi:hypothetical protein
MRDHLFKEPISIFAQQKLYEARTRAEQLTQQQLEGADLSEMLAQIATFKFELANLKPDQRKGKRRSEKRKLMDYGREVIIDVDIIDVTIPFSGWPRSFHLAPSSCVIIDTPATVAKDNAIEVSFPDDQNLDRSVDVFVRAVTKNLDTLGSELQKIPPQMLQTAQVVANQRLQQIRDRIERDKNRSFPIE